MDHTLVIVILASFFLGSLSKSPQTTSLDHELEFALAQARSIAGFISTINTTSYNDLAKSALVDCRELYEDSIISLARSTGPTTDPNDVRTMLSASLSNIETCKNGFIDFHLFSELESFPFLSHPSNFSKHLSNSLALLKLSSFNNSMKQSKTDDDHFDDFPAWVSSTDRRLLQSSSSSGAPKPNIVVAQDGSGDYKTISEALGASESVSSERFIIYVKRGVYPENVVVKKSNIMMVGDGPGATIVTGSNNNQDGYTTFNSATFAVTGEGFIAQSITFQNTAGAAKHQAVALRSSADFSVFYRCSFEGYQDTLYLQRNRQFYRECTVEGTVDFIFGDAVGVLQNCVIILRRPLENQKNTVTAQGRTDPSSNTGIVIHNSRITGPGLGSVQSYLGRPWKEFSRTVIMKTAIDGAIVPAGWLPWSGDFSLTTLYYAEFGNTGAGAFTGERVKWAGFHILATAAEAGQFSVGEFLNGNSWIASTGVPYTAGV